MNPTNIVQQPQQPLPQPMQQPQYQQPQQPQQPLPQPMQQPQYQQPVQPQPIQPIQPLPNQNQYPNQEQQQPQTPRYRVNGSKADLVSPGNVSFQITEELAKEKYSIWDPNMPKPNGQGRGYFHRAGETIPASNGMSYTVEQTKTFDTNTFKQLFGLMRTSLVYERTIKINDVIHKCDFPKSVEFGPRGYAGNVTGGIQGICNQIKARGGNIFQTIFLLSKQGQNLGTQYMVMEQPAGAQPQQPIQPIQPVQPVQPIQQQQVPQQIPQAPQAPQAPVQPQPQPMQQVPQPIQPPPQPQPVQPVPQQQPPLDQKENQIVQKFKAAGFVGLAQKQQIIIGLTSNFNESNQPITPDRAEWIFTNFMAQ